MLDQFIEIHPPEQAVQVDLVKHLVDIDLVKHPVDIDLVKHRVQIQRGNNKIDRTFGDGLGQHLHALSLKRVHRIRVAAHGGLGPTPSG